MHSRPCPAGRAAGCPLGGRGLCTAEAARAVCADTRRRTSARRGLALRSRVSGPDRAGGARRRPAAHLDRPRHAAPDRTGGPRWLHRPLELIAVLADARDAGPSASEQRWPTGAIRADRRCGERAAAVGGVAGAGRGHRGRALGARRSAPAGGRHEALATLGPAATSRGMGRRATVTWPRGPGLPPGGARWSWRRRSRPRSRRAAGVALLAASTRGWLGWASREPLVPGAHAREVLPGGGILRPVVLAGRVRWHWRGDVGRSRGRPGRRRRRWRRVADVRRFLGSVSGAAAGYTLAPMDSLSRRALSLSSP